MLKKVLVVALLGLSSTAFAGGFQIKVGASLIDPTADTTLAPGATVKGDHEFAFTPSVEYFFGDTPYSADVLLANPINHDVLLNGEKVSSVRQLPPTITAKYNFKNSTRFTPYIGVGGTAFIAWHEKGVADDVKNAYGVAGQLGFNFQPADAKNWGVFVDARYAQIKPEVQIEGVPNFDLDINPMIYTMGYSYKF